MFDFPFIFIFFNSIKRIYFYEAWLDLNLLNNFAFCVVKKTEERAVFTNPQLVLSPCETILWPDDCALPFL